MRKLLSLVLAFAMILGTFAFPVSADGDSYQAVGEELKALGVLSGDQNGDLKADNELTREEALVVLARLMGKLDEAQATEAESGFADVPAGHWAAKIIAYAKAQKWVAGKSETEFGLGQKVTTKEALSFMMRALGYEADWAKEDIMKKASELGLMKDVTAEADKALLRGELFIVMKNTLYTKPMGEKTELVYKLGLKENPVPETLEVVDVKAENLREVVVEFNQEVDKDTLENAFSSVGLNLSKVDIHVEEDGKTVVLRLTQTMKNKSDYKITISKVKSLGGVMMEKVVKEFKTEDNEVPKIEKLEVTGPKTFDIVFSEPINAKSPGTVKVKINGKTGPGASLSIPPTTEATRRISVKTTSEMKDGTTYTVLVTGFQDFAKYKNIDTEMELDYAKVTTAPTVEVVKATQEYVVLKFDRPVRGLENNNFYHTYSAWKPVYSYSSVESMKFNLKQSIKRDESHRVVVIRFLDTVKEFVAKPNDKWHPLPTGDVEVNVLGQVGSRKVVDNWGNQLQDTEIMVNVTADKTAPVIESVEAIGENKIEVTYSKEVILDQANYEVLNADGAKFSGSYTTTTGEGKKAVITLNKVNLVGKSVILNVKNVKDATINMNKLVGTESFNVSFGDKTFDGIKQVVLHEPKDGVAKLFVIYKEAMDSESATNIKNYKFTFNTDVEKDQFGIDADTSMYSDSIVQITMDKEVYNEFFGPYAVGSPVTAYKKGAQNLRLVVSRDVKDVAGNSWGGFTLSQVVDPKSTAPQVATNNKGEKKISATGRNRIVVTFDQIVQTEGQALNSTYFTVKEGTTNKAVETVNILDSRNQVEIVLKDALASTTTETITVNYTNPGPGKDDRLVNELTEALNPAAGVLAAAGEVKDGIAPEYRPNAYVEGVAPNTTTHTWTDAQYFYVGGNNHKVVVRFSEAVNLSGIGTQAFILKDYNGDRHTINSITHQNGTPVADGDVTTLVLNFTISDDDMPRFLKGLKDIYENNTATKRYITAAGPTVHYIWQDMFTLSIDRDVNDKAKNLLTKDAINVYFSNEPAFIGTQGTYEAFETGGAVPTDNNGVVALLKAKSYDDITKVTKAEFKVALPTNEQVLYTDRNNLEIKVEMQPKDAAESYSFEWFRKLPGGDFESVDVTNAVDGTSHASGISKLKYHADGIVNTAANVGVTEYKVVAKIVNVNGFTSEATSVVKVNLKKQALTHTENPKLVFDSTNQQLKTDAEGLTSKVVLTLEDLKFVAGLTGINGTGDATNLKFEFKNFAGRSFLINPTVAVSGEDRVVTLDFTNAQLDAGASSEQLGGTLEITVVGANVAEAAFLANVETKTVVIAVEVK